RDRRRAGCWSSAQPCQLTVERDLQVHLGPGAWCAGDLQSATGEVGALTHAAHPAALAVPFAHTLPVVAHTQHHALVARVQGDADAGGMGVTDGVGQGLLGYPVDDELALGRLDCQVAGDAAVDAQLGMLAHSPRESAQRSGETEVLERLRS